MERSILIGIDLGTTALKAGAFDARSGRRLAAASVRLPVRSRADGTREQDVGAVERALRGAAASIREQLGAGWRRVAGAGLCAQGGSAIVADRDTGRARTPMQLWNDMRPLHRRPGIAARKPPAYWRRFSYLDDPGAGLCRIEWLRERQPGLFDGSAIYAGAGEYLYQKLTGAWRQDAGNALQIGCYDARRRRIIASPLRLVGAEPSLVAPMRDGHEVHALARAGARLLGLPEGVPVAGPYMDHEAGYLAAAGPGGRPLQCSLGTAWVGNFVARRGTPPPGFNLVLPSPVDDGDLIVRVIAAGTATWDWAVGELLGRRGADGIRRAGAILRGSPLPPSGLVGLPWLTTVNPLVHGAVGAGGFLGVSPHTSPGDLLRAAAAGLCCEMAFAFGHVRDAGIVDRVVLAGGASNGPHFRRLLAAFFAPLPVFHVAAVDAPGARGCLWAFSRAAAAAPVRRVPGPSQDLRRRCLAALDEYNRACEALARGLPRGMLQFYHRGTAR